jgi:hypothetical protein
MATRHEIEDLIAKVKPYQPGNLYRYRTIDKRELPGIFTTQKVYLSDAMKFNDPFETMPLLRVSRSEVVRNRYLMGIVAKNYPRADRNTRRRLARSRRHRLTDQDFLRKICDEVISSTGVYCLSERNADLLMWAHYSDGHKGICLEFDSTAAGTFFWEAARVAYQEEYPKVNMQDLGSPQNILAMHLTKSTHWSHEREWRIVKFGDEGGPGDYAFQPSLLTGVILGARIPPADEQQVRDWVASYPERITIYQARLDERKYQVDITRAKGA